MITYIKHIFFLLVVVYILSSCKDDETVNVPPTSTPKELEVHDFVWRALNTNYLWQADSPDLADKRFPVNEDYLNFLRGFEKPEDLFTSLKLSDEKDMYSWIIDDYDELDKYLNGVEKSNGVSFTMYRKATGNDEVYGAVLYIKKNSYAEQNTDIKRGEIFYGVNGTKLTTSNYNDLLSSSDTYVLNMANYVDGVLIPNDRNVSLTNLELDENPINEYKVIKTGTHNIGYLLCTGFYQKYDEELNKVFGEFKAQNVTDFVLDLRYITKGSSNSALRLASMITGQFTAQLFSKDVWNEKMQKYYETNFPGVVNQYFTNNIFGAPINSLRMNKVYIITSKSGTTASEAILNGLIAYIPVVHLGDSKAGRGIGSVSIYDSKDFSKKNLNPNHKYAIQLSTFISTNKLGNQDFHTQFDEGNKLSEDPRYLGTLGDENEPLFKRAITLITGNAGRSAPLKTIPDEEIANSRTIKGQRSIIWNEFPKTDAQ